MILKTKINFRSLMPLIYKTANRKQSTLIEAKEKLKVIGGGSVHLEKDDASSIATITIDNARRRNALSGNMMVQLEEIVTELESWSTGKGVILRGAGDFFCSGGDLSTLESSFNYGMLMSTFMHNALTRLYCLPMITLSLVRGKAIGGGAELITATDFRILTSSAEISFVQGKMGVVTGWGGGTRLVNLLGAKTALELLITSKKISNEEALQVGLADRIVEAEDPEDVAIKFLMERMKHDYTVVRAMKQIIVGARDLSFHDSLLNERKTFAPLWGGPANLKALKNNIKH